MRLVQITVEQEAEKAGQSQSVSESLRPTLTDQCLSSRCHLFRAVQPSEEAWPCDHSMHLGQGYSLDLSHSTLRESMRQAENCVSLKLSEYLLKKLFEAQ
jgi:hypothetical protein